MPATSVAQISSLHIYPIKSTAGINIPYAKVEELGLAFDRRFVISDPSGQFITARTDPKLCLIHTTLLENGIELSVPSMPTPTLTLRYSDFTSQYQKVSVWGDEIDGQICSEKANTWFSEYLQRPCTLLFFGESSYRERKPKTDEARKLAFADGYPLLLISQASLDELNSRLESQQQQTVSMSQFRPNIVIENTLPFAEDSWQHIRIGEVEFKVSKPCERCVFTTVNPATAKKHPQQQPLRMLSSFRQTEQGEVLFGQNLIALNSGTIRITDKLTIIAKKEPPTFITKDLSNEVLDDDDNTLKNNNLADHIVDKSSNTSVNQNITVFFEKWNKKHHVPADKNTDNDSVEKQAKTLLEHGEDAGLILPYSCRAGMCGRCKAKLISGEVKQLSTDGLTDQEKEEGYILCCTAIAASDVVIKHT